MVVVVLVLVVVVGVGGDQASLGLLQVVPSWLPLRLLGGGGALLGTAERSQGTLPKLPWSVVASRGPRRPVVGG